MTQRKKQIRKFRPFGFSLLELLAVVTILGIIAVVVIPRITVSASTAKKNADAQNKAEINSAVERWYFEKGSWPADLNVMSADVNYFPNGVPLNPDTGLPYTLDANHRVK